MTKHCLICHTREVFAFTKHSYRLYRCPSCHLLRTQLRESPQHLLRTYYSAEYFTGRPSRAGYADYIDDETVIRRNAQMFLKLIACHLHRFPGRRLLDIGCATGTFMRQAQSQGFRVAGVDVSDFAISQARKNFPRQIHHGTLATAKFRPGSFDLITLLDVFEHLPHPIQELARCRRLLKPSGLLVINTGDTDSFMAKLEGQRWHYFIPPQHLFFYSKNNLQQLLHQNGFKVLAAYITGKHISLRYLWHLMRTINHSQLADWFYRHFHATQFGKLSFYLNLRDNMTIIAKKK